MTDPTKSATPLASGSFRRNNHPCPVHSTKRGDLFCLTCELVICSKCMTESREHTRHAFDTVRDTYIRRLATTEIKLEILDRYIDAQQRTAEQFTSLLEILRRNEADLVNRLDRIVNEAKAELETISNEKAKLLDPSMLTIKLKCHYRDELLAEIANLSEAEFLIQQADINNRCDSLMTTSVHNPLDDPSDCCNVFCSLLPTIEMDSHCINIIDNDSFNFTSVDQYGFKWGFELATKKTTNATNAELINILQLDVKMERSGKPQGNFLIILNIVHELPLKTLTQHIPIKSLNRPQLPPISQEIADIRYLQNEGFITKDDQLQFQIGIGPEDPITERKCYQKTLKIHRNQICALKCELANWKKYNISYFRIEECPNLASKRSKTKQTNVIMDEHGVNWQLKVSINGNHNRGFIGVFLTKCNGSKGWYDYFIELFHTQSEKHNRSISGCHFFDVDPLELPQFMAIAFLDPFMDKGTVRLRFGTRKNPQQTTDCGDNK